MTDAEFTFYVRSLLNEAEAKARFWTPDDIDAYKQVGISIVNGLFWNLLYPFRKKQQGLDVTATVRTIDLPTGCQKVVRVEYYDTGEKFRYITEEDVWTYEELDPGDPVAFTFQEGKIYLFPEPISDLTNFLRIWYLPRATTLADLPEELHPLIAVEAVIAGREKDEKVSPSLEMKRQRFHDAAVKALLLPITQSEGEDDLEYY
jgi:hypothetical protein